MLSLFLMSAFSVLPKPPIAPPVVDDYPKSRPPVITGSRSVNPIRDADEHLRDYAPSVPPIRDVEPSEFKRMQATPKTKTCLCSDKCTCGCNDGFPCRCGQPQPSQGAAAVPYQPGMILSPPSPANYPPVPLSQGTHTSGGFRIAAPPPSVFPFPPVSWGTGAAFSPPFASPLGSRGYVSAPSVSSRNC